MKKLLALVAVMSLTAAANAGMIVTKVSLDGQGTIAGNVDAYAANVSPGVGIAAEYLNKSQEINNMSYGLGLEYQFMRPTALGDGYFGFIPLYLTGQYAFWNNSCCKPYVKLNLGYDLVFNGTNAFRLGSSLNGGVYYSAGVGAHIYKDAVIAELMYSTYVGAFNGIVPPSIIPTISNDTYSVVALKVGYCFDLSK